MIAQIRGHLIQKEPGGVVLEANGIGYQILVSLHTFYELPEVGQPACLFTYMHVREDLLQLYGFSSSLEKDLFQILISVSGIGPKLALGVLSRISPQELLSSLHARDLNRLLSIPGIGRKMAERMVVDLQEKAQKIGIRRSLLTPERLPVDAMTEDVISALINLGYKKGQAEKAIENVIREVSDPTLENLLKATLQVLASN
jgi:Holliday junction DNA helicase RuvA